MTSGGAISKDVLAIKHGSGSNVTLDSLDPRKEYLKPESIEQKMDVQIEKKKSDH